MKKTKLTISKIFASLFLISPLVFFFSYYPLISFGSTESMNFELSLPLIWLVLFDICAAILYFREYRKLPALTLKLVLYLLFPIYVSLSIFWSPNFVRGFLTAGIIWLIFIAIYLSYKLAQYLKPLKPNLVKSIFISSIAVATWCWIQSILDLAGLDRTQTLMCRGCATTTFGFPHPNGFAVEPQFMGNLLLAPTLLAIFYWVKKPSIRRASILIFLSATLFFVFSRGAIYSFGLATILLLVCLVIRLKSARPLLVIPFLLLSFVCSLNAQGLMAAASSTNDTYWSGVFKSLDQMTLGVFDFKTEQQPTSTAGPDADKTQEDTPSQESVFDGYVEISTVARLTVSSASLRVWSNSPTNLFFGVGLGGSGQALYQAGELSYQSENGQNEYCTILLEIGLVGAILLVIVLFEIFKKVHLDTEYTPLLFAILLAYAVSIFFFSGVTNALHLYLMPIFWSGYISSSSSKNS